LYSYKRIKRVLSSRMPGALVKAYTLNADILFVLFAVFSFWYLRQYTRVYMVTTLFDGDVQSEATLQREFGKLPYV